MVVEGAESNCVQGCIVISFHDIHTEENVQFGAEDQDVEQIGGIPAAFDTAVLARGVVFLSDDDLSIITSDKLSSLFPPVDFFSFFSFFDFFSFFSFFSFFTFASNVAQVGSADTGSILTSSIFSSSAFCSTGFSTATFSVFCMSISSFTFSSFYFSTLPSIDEDREFCDNF